MKKSFKFNELSDKVCEGKDCDRKIKMRRHVEYWDTLCYRCYQRKLKAAGYGHRNLKANVRKAGDEFMKPATDAIKVLVDKHQGAP